MIRYYKYTGFSEYIVVTDHGVLIIHDSGDISFRRYSKKWDDLDHGYMVISEAPDAGSIEHFYLNATDNPYKDGFKYPKAGLEASHGA